MSACDRFEREGLLQIERGQPLDERLIKPAGMVWIVFLNCLDWLPVGVASADFEISYDLAQVMRHGH